MVAAIVCCPAMAGAAFGIFDHVDLSDEPIGTLYEHRLRLVEAAEAAGFRTYHVAEHHATRLGMAPSPRDLPRRGGAADAADPVRTPRLSLAALHAAPAHRGDRDARPDERRP